MSKSKSAPTPLPTDQPGQTDREKIIASGWHRIKFGTNNKSELAIHRPLLSRKIRDLKALGLVEGKDFFCFYSGGNSASQPKDFLYDIFVDPWALDRLKHAVLSTRTLIIKRVGEIADNEAVVDLPIMDFSSLKFHVGKRVRGRISTHYLESQRSLDQRRSVKKIRRKESPAFEGLLEASDWQKAGYQIRTKDGYVYGPFSSQQELHDWEIHLV